MAKTREQKGKSLLSLDESLESAKSAVLIDYRGLKVKETEELRNLLRAKNVSMHIVKNSLVKIALKKKGIEIDEGIFKKPVAIAFSLEDEVAPAKEIVLFAKKHEAVEILAGILENKMISASTVTMLSRLPSKDQLRAQLVGTIAAPLNGLVNVLSGNLRGLINVLSAYSKAKGE
ncbi:MAG: 50S ribosomal protein L10 [Candidatus Berkelbacteria bacterium]